MLLCNIEQTLYSIPFIGIAHTNCTLLYCVLGDITVCNSIICWKIFVDKIYGERFAVTALFASNGSRATSCFVYIIVIDALFFSVSLSFCLFLDLHSFDSIIDVDEYKNQLNW